MSDILNYKKKGVRFYLTPFGFIAEWPMAIVKLHSAANRQISILIDALTQVLTGLKMGHILT